MSGTLAFVATPSTIRPTIAGTLQIVDVSNPISPTLLSIVGGMGGDVQVVGHLAYVVGAGLRVLDIRDPANPVVQSTLKDFSLSDAAHLRVVGGVGYVTSGLELRLYDVHDPQAPRLLSALSLPDTIGNSPFVVRDGLLYSASEKGVAIFDVRDPARPSLRGLVGVPGRATDIALDGPLVYVASGDAGLHALRINPDAFSRVLLPLVSDGLPPPDAP